MPVVAEQLRKGDRVLLEPCCSTEPRVAVIEDNETQSLVRHVEIESLNGYEADSYAVFADEITGYVNPKGMVRPVRPSAKHLKRLHELRLHITKTLTSNFVRSQGLCDVRSEARANA